MHHVARKVIHYGVSALIVAVLSPWALADDGQCAGTVQPPPPGFTEVNDPDLLAKAIGAPEQGKLCTGKVYQLDSQADKLVVVYRVWDASRPYTSVGSWWSFDSPQGPRDAYRAQNEICPDWSALNKVSMCTIKPGSKIVVGPGQSAKCSADLTYPTSPANQVFIPNDTRNNMVYVENCTEGEDWPAGGQ